ncbi:MAG: cell division protein FtsH, partial [Desulfatirhabdiaceae bacterium]
LSRATDIARSMVKEYGMSPKLGQVYFASGQRSPFMNVMPESQNEYSEATAELIDTEIQEIISSQYRQSLDILKSRQTVLKKAFHLLLEKETIEGKELLGLMAEKEDGR